MNTLFASIKQYSSRYQDVGFAKAEGATYTPPLLASFVATEMLRIATLPSTDSINLLDPAVGDGALLSALLSILSPDDRARCVAYGYDTHREALSAGERILHRRFPKVELRFKAEDFLRSPVEQHFDLVIANPPYVRTQVLGAEQAQELADLYGLTGRVDLYYPFLLAISRVLAPSGTLGVITSNRFLTTRSGQSVRKELLLGFRIRKVWDLGDTKLFDAAVLPAVTIAQGLQTAESTPMFSSIYENPGTPTAIASDSLAALAFPDATIAQVQAKNYLVRHGTLDNGGRADGVWRLANANVDDWLRTVEAHTWKTFRQIGKIRVGVKTTADKVFSRSDWSSLPGGEPELLRPLLTRHNARSFRALEPGDARKRKRILYPHLVGLDGRRVPANLEHYPIAKNYLESYRDQLEARTYVIEGGRRWYEIWVPQDPAGWAEPKLVFLDISEKPTFWMDRDGAIVNGECYFLRSNHSNIDLLWLALAIANSSFIEAFYDKRFNNKLYSGRRRFITQYVEQFPLPDPARPEVTSIICDSKRMYELAGTIEGDQLAKVLEEKVWRAFGLLPK